eukprot:SAG11_NODE_37476_length_256_cov_2.273885_1_plen_43_part_10
MMEHNLEDGNPRTHQSSPTAKTSSTTMMRLTLMVHFDETPCPI